MGLRRASDLRRILPGRSLASFRNPNWKEYRIPALAATYRRAFEDWPVNASTGIGALRNTLVRGGSEGFLPSIKKGGWTARTVCFFPIKILFIDGVFTAIDR